LLISDVGLPGLNGRQLAEAARAMDADLPILLITGYTRHAMTEAALTAGVAVMRKPFAIDALTERVRAMLTRVSRQAS
jgi:DNA-binding response OmpR family regulator